MIKWKHLGQEQAFFINKWSKIGRILIFFNKKQPIHGSIWDKTSQNNLKHGKNWDENSLKWSKMGQYGINWEKYSPKNGVKWESAIYLHRTTGHCPPIPSMYGKIKAIQQQGRQDHQEIEPIDRGAIPFRYLGNADFSVRFGANPHGRCRISTLSDLVQGRDQDF